MLWQLKVTLCCLLTTYSHVTVKGVSSMPSWAFHRIIQSVLQLSGLPRRCGIQMVGAFSFFIIFVCACAILRPCHWNGKLLKCCCLWTIVYPDGKVCISILHPPGDDPNGYELATERWSPVHTVCDSLMFYITASIKLLAVFINMVLVFSCLFFILWTTEWKSVQNCFFSSVHIDVNTKSCKEDRRFLYSCFFLDMLFSTP
jgi:hypothetical protein